MEEMVLEHFFNPKLTIDFRFQKSPFTDKMVEFFTA